MSEGLNRHDALPHHPRARPHRAGRAMAVLEQARTWAAAGRHRDRAPGRHVLLPHRDVPDPEHRAQRADVVVRALTTRVRISATAERLLSGLSENRPEATPDLSVENDLGRYCGRATGAKGQRRQIACFDAVTSPRFPIKRWLR